jgi:phosphoribosylaminoimidazole-succinocarboxamide synthase
MTTMPSVVTQTATSRFAPSKQGKVRDLYDLGDSLLIVATDRLSAFDVVLPDGIPNKGKVLTQISSFWFQRLTHIVSNHIISVDLMDFPEPFKSAPEVFAGRSMLVKKTKPLAVECVVRGYMSGSGWSDYKKTQTICGIKLPPGLSESEKLPEPIFTPSTKAPIGVHDENISFQDVVNTLGAEVASKVRDLSISMYTQGADYAATKGIIIADTKFEFGVDEEGEIIWIDEALTPDSSRFWPEDRYKPGGPQPSFDKQFVRDYLLSIHWDKTPPGPRLPENVIRTTSAKYEEALRLLSGHGVQ